MDKLNTYRCWYSNGASVPVDAYTVDDAKRMAEECAIADGYPGLSVVRIETV